MLEKSVLGKDNDFSQSSLTLTVSPGDTGWVAVHAVCRGAVLKQRSNGPREAFDRARDSIREEEGVMKVCGFTSIRRYKTSLSMNRMQLQEVHSWLDAALVSIDLQCHPPLWGIVQSLIV